jgi:hypothetical protein
VNERRPTVRNGVADDPVLIRRIESLRLVHWG